VTHVVACVSFAAGAVECSCGAIVRTADRERAGLTRRGPNEALADAFQAHRVEAGAKRRDISSTIGLRLGGKTAVGRPGEAWR